ncbi:MAG: ribonuclease HII [Hyphomicrobiales bacterium]|nr:MAG: ribonuclease HII [Hyphomicrobiales bacterium]
MNSLNENISLDPEILITFFPPPNRRPDFKLDQYVIDIFGGDVAGVDEAGRGPLAGPVVVAAVILDPENIPDGLDDSKKLPRAKREHLFEEIMQTAIVSIVSACPEKIDHLNIRGATLWAMAKSVTALAIKPAHILVDGRDVPPPLTGRATSLIKGDSRSSSIAAASIVAKVTRDRQMILLGEHFPQYGFEQNKGYGTRQHRNAIKTHGPTLHHRRSFNPVKSMLS